MFTFNPPTASAMPENAPQAEPQRLPYELRRVMIGSSMQLRVRRVGPKPPRSEEDTRPQQYTRPCKRASSPRNACYNEIDVYRVVTGTHTVPLYPHADPVHTRTVEDCVYYWADTAIVVETATDYSIRPVQAGFCSMKCLSLWAAKIARDTES